jgi:hypothetical protein
MNKVSESEAQSFRVLGLAPDATLAEVRRAFRKQAMHNHPDRNPGDPEAEARFRAILEAYQGATQAIKRQARDPDSDRRAGPEPKPAESSTNRQPGTRARRPNQTRSDASRRPVRVQRNLARQIFLGLRAFNRMLLFILFVVGPVLFVLAVIWITTRTNWL